MVVGMLIWSLMSFAEEDGGDPYLIFGNYFKFCLLLKESCLLHICGIIYLPKKWILADHLYNMSNTIINLLRSITLHGKIICAGALQFLRHTIIFGPNFSFGITCVVKKRISTMWLVVLC